MNLNSFYIHGWKEIARTIGVSVRTLKRWHYGKLALPIQKFGEAQQARVCVSRALLFLWLRQLEKLSKDLAALKR